MKIFDDLHAFLWQSTTTNNCNAYFIDGTKKIIIDPGYRHLMSHIENGLARSRMTPDDIDVILITHGHPDHIEGAFYFGESVLVAMGQVEYEFIKDVAGEYAGIQEPDFFLQEGDITIGDHTFQIIPAPGHSPGSICIYWPERKTLFTGDVIFKQGVGRTDLPGGNGGTLKESIQKLAKLDVEYLMPGHGDIVVGKEEVQSNFKMIERLWFNYLE